MLVNIIIFGCGVVVGILATIIFIFKLEGYKVNIDIKQIDD